MADELVPGPLGKVTYRPDTWQHSTFLLTKSTGISIFMSSPRCHMQCTVQVASHARNEILCYQAPESCHWVRQTDLVLQAREDSLRNSARGSAKSIVKYKAWTIVELLKNFGRLQFVSAVFESCGTCLSLPWQVLMEQVPAATSPTTVSSIWPRLATMNALPPQSDGWQTIVQA